MIHASKQFRPNLLMGQRFLTSRPILEKIIAAAGLSDKDTVLEIGPGTGALTIELAKRAGRVIAVEKDKKLFELLELKLKQENIGNVRLILGDILKIPNPYTLTPIPYKVVANIPYYLTSRLIRMFLENENQPAEMLLMVQKEVAERIVAKPPKTNLLAISIRTYAEPRLLFKVSRNDFRPRPKIDSAFIGIGGIGKKFFARNRIQKEKFFKIVQAAFRGKRKTLENSLSKNLKLPKSKILEILDRLGLAGKRPEMLSLGKWAELIHQLP